VNRQNRRGTIIFALLAGFVVLALLFPASGVDSQPPVCRSIFGYVVPCEAWVAWVAAVVTAGLVGWAVWATLRNRV
jgi:hypothetical protein